MRRNSMQPPNNSMESIKKKEHGRNRTQTDNLHDHMSQMDLEDNNNDNMEEGSTNVIPRKLVPTPVAPPVPLSASCTPQMNTKAPPKKYADTTPQNPKRLLYPFTPNSNNSKGTTTFPNNNNSSIISIKGDRIHVVSSSSDKNQVPQHQQEKETKKLLIQSPPERHLTTNSRVNYIVSQLQELNILSSTKPFLSTIQVIQKSIASCTTFANREQQSNALHGILQILETAVEEIQNTSQECKYWQQKASNQQHYSDTTIISQTSSLAEDEDVIYNSSSMASASSSNSYKVNSQQQQQQHEQQQQMQMNQVKNENAKLRTILEDMGFSYLIDSSGGSVASNMDDTATQYSTIERDLQSKVSSLQNENASLRQSVQELSNARFQLEMQYNKALLSSSCSPSTKDSTRIAIERKRTQELLKQEQQLHAALAKKDMECVHAQETIHRLQMQTEMLQSNQMAQSKSFKQYQIELETLRRETQNLAVENARLQSETSTLRQKLSQEMKRADQCQHDAHAAQLGRNELASRCHAIADERSRLERELESTSRDNADMSNKLSSFHLEQSRLQNQIQVLGADVQQRVSQIHDLENELEQSRNKVNSLGSKLAASDRKNMELAQDLESSRQSSKIIGQQTLELQRLLAKSQHDATAFRSMTTELEEERDMWEKSLHEEKNKGLEELLASARANEAAASEQVKKLARQNAHLATRLNEVTARQQR